MATNEKFTNARTLYVTVPSGTVAGDPVAYGQKAGVAITSRDADGKATVQFEGVFTLSVKGIDGGGNAAIAEGAILYHTVGDTPKVNVKTTGVRFGYAKGAVVSGATTTIDVILGY